jgi:hypothetical protein
MHDYMNLHIHQHIHIHIRIHTHTHAYTHFVHTYIKVHAASARRHKLDPLYKILLESKNRKDRKILSFLLFDIKKAEKTEN